MYKYIYLYIYVCVQYTFPANSSKAFMCIYSMTSAYPHNRLQTRQVNPLRFPPLQTYTHTHTHTCMYARKCWLFDHRRLDDDDAIPIQWIKLFQWTYKSTLMTKIIVNSRVLISLAAQLLIWTWLDLVAATFMSLLHYSTSFTNVLQCIVFGAMHLKPIAYICASVFSLTLSESLYAAVVILFNLFRNLLCLMYIYPSSPFGI